MDNVNTNKIEVANLKISAITTQEFLDMVKTRIASSKKTFVVTPNSEFLYASLRDNRMRDLFNSADISLADGISILWAERFLARRFIFKNFWLKVLQCWIDVVVTGARILLTPQYLYKTIPEKITGASVFLDLAKLASENSFSIFLVNDWGNSAQLTAEVLKKKFPNLRIAGVSTKSFNDPSLIDDINTIKPDMLFLAYGQPKQEHWISEHLPRIETRFAMGVGGTFDYTAGKKINPPRFVRTIGLEWLFRLFTQPRRLPRIYRATWGLVLSLVRYKVFSSCAYRENVSMLVTNKDNKFLLCRLNPDRKTKNGSFHKTGYNYWQLPQGGIDEGEDAIAAAVRELQEETGMKNVKVLGIANYVNQYDWPNGYRGLIRTRRRFRGQRQQLVFLKYEGRDEEIVLEEEVFAEWRWFTAPELIETIAHERKPQAREGLKEFQEMLENTP